MALRLLQQRLRCAATNVHLKGWLYQPVVQVRRLHHRWTCESMLQECKSMPQEKFD